MDEVFKFEEYFNTYMSNTKKLDEEIKNNDNNFNLLQEDFFNNKKVEEVIENNDYIVEDEVEDDYIVENEVDDEVDDEEYFKIYKDKSEEFKCNIQVEGSSIENTEARLIIESENWKLVFDGEIVNGKCIIPIKKLNILNENEIGNIKLEVITEGSIFVPWEDKFKVHVSKKVIFSLDESLKNKKTNNPNNKKDNKIGVKVNFK